MSQRNAKRPKQPCPSVGCEANVRQVASHVSHVHVKALRRKIESLARYVRRVNLSESLSEQGIDRGHGEDW